MGRILFHKHFNKNIQNVYFLNQYMNRVHFFSISTSGNAIMQFLSVRMYKTVCKVHRVMYILVKILHTAISKGILNAKQKSNIGYSRKATPGKKKHPTMDIQLDPNKAQLTLTLTLLLQT